MSAIDTTLDTAGRRVPPLGGFSLTVLRIELRRMLRNRNTLVVRAAAARGALPLLRLHRGLAGERRQRQRRGLHHGLDGAVRRRADRSVRRHHGGDGALPGLVAPAAADPAAPGRARGHQGPPRAGARRGRDRRGQHRRRGAGQAGDAAADLAGVRAAEPAVHAGVRGARRARRASWSPGRTPCRSSAPAWRCCRSSATSSSRSTRAPRSTHVAQWTPMFGVAEISRYPLTDDLAVDGGAQRRGLAGPASSPAPPGG